MLIVNIILYLVAGWLACILLCAGIVGYAQMLAYMDKHKNKKTIKSKK